MSSFKYMGILISRFKILNFYIINEKKQLIKAENLARGRFYEQIVSTDYVKNVCSIDSNLRDP